MGLMSIFYGLYFLDSPNMEGQVPVFISPWNRVVQYMYTVRPTEGFDGGFRPPNCSTNFLWQFLMEPVIQ
jgi:hypothetical protein